MCALSIQDFDHASVCQIVRCAAGTEKHYSIVALLCQETAHFLFLGTEIIVFNRKAETCIIFMRTHWKNHDNTENL